MKLFNRVYRQVLVALCAVVVALGVIPSLPASAAPSSGPLAVSAPGVNNCGNTSCSYYFKRSVTRRIGTEGVHYLDAIIKLVPGGVAKAIVGLGGGAIIVKAREAMAKNQCLRIRYGIPAGLYADGSQYCKD